MNKNNKVIKNFKSTTIIQSDMPSIETIKNSTGDLKKIFSRLKGIQNRIKICKSIEELNKNINLSEISSDLGMIVQSSIIFDDISFKKNIEEANQLYRETELLYFDKKIELLNKNIKMTFQKSQNSLKEITGGTLFSIASVFLGISLTSSLVSGVQYVEPNFIILYFLTCLLIAIITIGLSAIFMRNMDAKVKVIMSVIGIVSIIWIIVAYFSYSNIDNGKINSGINEKKSELENEIINSE